VVTILNTGSVPAAGGRRGLKHIGAELRRFGATLEGLGNLDAPWTYGISICLERWSQV
jgi:hypothetical protein